MDRPWSINPALLLFFNFLTAAFPASSNVITVKAGAEHLKTGESVILTCTVSGPTPSKYQVTWTKGLTGTLPSRFQINKPTRTQLVISSAVPSDSGDYYCHYNGQYAFGTVAVFDPPVINYHLDVQVKEQSNAKLTCTGKNYIKINWMKDGKVLATDSKQGETLLIQNVTTSDAGLYQCKAQNTVAVTTETVILTVETLPEIISNPLNQTVLEKYDAKFICNATGIPPPSITWQRDAKISVVDPQYLITETGVSSQLLIENVQKADKGDYYCIAVNKYGIVESKRAHLTIVQNSSDIPPESVTTVAYKTIRFGVNSSLACGTGLTNPPAQWSKDGHQLNKTALLDLHLSIEPNSRQLVITEAAYKHSGMYICEIHLVWRQKVFVTVRGPPDPPKNLTAQLDVSRHVSEKRANVSWIPPEFNGNSPVTGYRLHWRVIKDSIQDLYWKSRTFNEEIRNTSVDLSAYIELGEANYRFEFTMLASNAFAESKWTDFGVIDYALVLPSVDDQTELPTNNTVVWLTGDSDASNWNIIVSVVIVFLFLTICVLLLVFYILRKRKQKKYSLQQTAQDKKQNLYSTSDDLQGNKTTVVNEDGASPEGEMPSVVQLSTPLLSRHFSSNQTSNPTVGSVSKSKPDFNQPAPAFRVLQRPNYLRIQDSQDEEQLPSTSPSKPFLKTETLV
eukprot:m.17644 g.17644  ORF g.17644 m.17644 type:complete len:678 (+) comp27525_c0_seq1:152-2185(+)